MKKPTIAIEIEDTDVYKPPTVLNIAIKISNKG